MRVREIIDFQCYNAAEESCIEYIACLERQENLGLLKDDIDKRVLDCCACYQRGKCTSEDRKSVSRSQNPS